MKTTPKRDCTNCGWGVEWKLDLGPHGEERLRGRCRFQPIPKFCQGLRSTISVQAEPATDCPAWKKASGPVPPWGVWTVRWILETLIEKEREAWDDLPPELQKEFEARGITRP